MRFLPLVSRVPTPASFSPLFAEMSLPSARTFGSIHHYKYLQILIQGTLPHKLTPIPGVFGSFQRTLDGESDA